MSQLAILRSQLASLLRQRRIVRWVAAYSALAAVVLWILAGIFLLDVIFETSRLQRLVVFAVAAAALVWAFSRFTRPLLGVRETLQEMALLVERQQQIDCDLIAALQFESLQSAAWGSTQLRRAVVGYVGQLGHELNVYEGFSRATMIVRALTLLVSAALLGSLALANSDYSQVFFNRLLFGTQHYPTATVIDRIVVNGELVSQPGNESPALAQVHGAEGQPLTFVVACLGKTPPAGLARFNAPGNQRSGEVALQPLSLEQRRDRLVEARRRIADAAQQTNLADWTAWTKVTAALAGFDAPRAEPFLRAAPDDRAGLEAAAAEIDSVLRAWPKAARGRDVYLGQLKRLTDDLHYRLFFGDAASAQGLVTMIPLPVVQLRLTPTPPDYAAAAFAQDLVEPGVRQISVLEGSLVEVDVQCTNGKQLTDVWMTLTADENAVTLPLTKIDQSGRRWRLLLEGTPLAQVRHEIRFEIQATDTDSLQLEAPLGGLIRLKADRRPTVTASSDYRAVLPDGSPVIRLQLADDYGIERLAVRARVIKSTGEGEAVEEGQEHLLPIDSLLPLRAGGAVDPDAEASRFPLHDENLPALGGYVLSLAPLKLAKGDRVSVSFVATDARGTSPGKSTRSDPLVLDVTDLAGMLAAMSQLDGRSEQKLTEIIDRQKDLLGIGNSP